jgi:GLPGLI family protein
MKLFLIILFFSSLCCQAQGIKVTYKAAGKEIKATDQIDNDQYKAYIQRMYEKINKVLPEIDFYIISEGKKYSFMYNIPMAIEGNQNYMELAVSKVMQGESVFVELENHYSYYLPQTLPFIRKINNDDIKWKITKQTKNILGFKVYRAIAEPKNENFDYKILLPIDAWFAPDLNFKGGPTAYGTLPGIILELSTLEVTFTASKIKKTKNDLPNLEAKGKKILTHHDFLEYYENWNKQNMPKKN